MNTSDNRYINFQLNKYFQFAAILSNDEKESGTFFAGGFFPRFCLV